MIADEDHACAAKIKVHEGTVFLDPFSVCHPHGFFGGLMQVANDGQSRWPRRQLVFLLFARPQTPRQEQS